MNTYIALFRGINVGGKNILPMKELIALLDGLQLQDISTYIQSGNVVFRSKTKDTRKLARDIRSAVAKRHDFEPQVLVLSAQEMRDAIKANLYPEDEPKALHLFFLESTPPQPNLEKLESLKADDENFMLTDEVFYLFAPSGVGRSKLAAGVERALGVAVTTRNWRTVSKVMAMTAEIGE